MLRNVCVLATLLLSHSQIALCQDEQQPVHNQHALVHQRPHHAISTFLLDNATIKTNCPCWNNLDELGSCPNGQCEALIEVKQSMSLQLQKYQLKVSPGAVLFLKHAGSQVEIYNCQDTSTHSVLLTNASQQADIPVGDMMTVDVADCGTALVPLTFNWTALAKKSELMRHLKLSKHDHDRRIWNHSLKTAACLTKVRGAVPLDYMFRNAETYNKGSLKVR